jgi:hypothetical protein
MADNKNRWWTNIAVEVGYIRGGTQRISDITNCYSILVWLPYGRDQSNALFKIQAENPTLEPIVDDVHGLYAKHLDMKGKIQFVEENVDNQRIVWLSKRWQSIDDFVWVCPDCNQIQKAPPMLCCCKFPIYTKEERLERRIQSLQ